MQPHVVITGANRGIGLALASQYKAAGYQVTAVCRTASPALESLDVTIISGIDVSDENAIHQLAAQLADQPIDLLINNAGILTRETLEQASPEDILTQFKVNALGPLMITLALRNNLRQGSKVALITSRMGSMQDNGSGGFYGYRMSKAALNAAGVSLANDLHAQGITVALLHPGYVQTEMVNHGGDISAETAAERLRQRIEEMSLKSTGTFRHSNGEYLPW